ncbi:MAG: hypothetical protein R2854_04220 [Caldilineaceae bacterium]
MAIGEDGWSFPGTSPIALAGRLIDQGLWGEQLVEQMNAHVSRQVRFANLVEQMPDPRNRVTPAFDRLDSFGLPRPRIHYRLGEFVERGMAAAREVSQAVFQEMDAYEIQHAEEHFGAGHLIGTYRMGGRFPGIQW